MIKLRLNLILVITVIFCVSPVYGYIFANETGGAYGNGGGTSGGISGPMDETANSINLLVIVGGGNVLKSSSKFKWFLNVIEMSKLNGINFIDLRKNIQETIIYMEAAKLNFYNLKQLAAVTPYNQEIISKLIDFDYESFQEKQKLNSIVFSKARDFLVKGDLTGCYCDFYSTSCLMLETLYYIKERVDKSVFPDITTIWKLNQQYIELQLFGQYIAQVFDAI